ncbi:MAG: 30S ribosomal protein S1 [Proteobacteria bacterium]|nr:30S ribosomal protein S1 [Pseudomonadota bacterium]NIS69412.1 30S ribosomal protein S1 [Pseudomonadota bacterium]
MEKNSVPPEKEDRPLADQADGEAGSSGKEEESFQKLYEESLKSVEEGEIVKGFVVAVNEDFVTVDIGYKSEGQISTRQFRTKDGQISVKEGDRVDVLLERKEIGDGLLVLSKEKADKFKAWREVSHACREGEVVEGEVIGKVKGGLTVDIGITAFLPGSQVDIRPVRNLDRFLGQKLDFKVIKCNRKRNNVVLSRRVLLEEQRRELRAQTLKSLREGELLEGVVKNITDYGVFIDLGGIDGLLHITDISWGRIGHPSEKLSVGDRVKVKVLNYDPDTERVSLGLKQTTSDPWEHAPQAYPIGARVKGKVVSVTDYGAFVQLEEGIEGLVHVSEMSWTRKIKHPSRIVNLGDIIEAVVLDIDPSKKRISLGMRQVEPNPWTVIESKYPVGTRLSGKVKTITDFGVFVGVEEGIDGLIHVSEMSWTKKIKNPSDMFKKGQEVEAVVLSIDKENERFSLGTKQLESDPWDEIPNKYRVGSRVRGRVTNLTDFGAFVELEPNIEGLVHVSELRKEKVNSPSDVVSVGETLEAVVINLDPRERRIGLSVKNLKDTDEKEEYERYLSEQSPTSSSLGELIQREMQRKSYEENQSRGEDAEDLSERDQKES